MPRQPRATHPRDATADRPPSDPRGATMTIAEPRQDAGSATPAVRPFTYTASDEELADLKRRIAATRWPERETVNDTSQGVRLEVVRALADYWANDYDWRPIESRLAGLPQFVTEIDGLDIHFIHVRSPHADALPM